jgi:hypothetical protein
MTETTAATRTITRVWRNSDGTARAADVTSPAGGRYTAVLDRGWIQWAEVDVWADPAAHGLTRFTCPGHNGQVCFYGMCDEIRVADLEGLRAAAGAFRETASDAYQYGLRDGHTAGVFRDGPESCRPERAVAERHAAMYRNGWEHAYRASIPVIAA